MDFVFFGKRRKEEFDKSAAGRAAKAQLQQMAKQSANTNKGEPVLKVCSFSQLDVLYIKLYSLLIYLSLLFFAMNLQWQMT